MWPKQSSALLESPVFPSLCSSQHRVPSVGIIVRIKQDPKGQLHLTENHLFSLDSWENVASLPAGSPFWVQHTRGYRQTTTVLFAQRFHGPVRRADHQHWVRLGGLKLEEGKEWKVEIHPRASKTGLFACTVPWVGLYHLTESSQSPQRWVLWIPAL